VGEGDEMTKSILFFLISVAAMSANEPIFENFKLPIIWKKAISTSITKHKHIIAIYLYRDNIGFTLIVYSAGNEGKAPAVYETIRGMDPGIAFLGRHMKFVDSIVEQSPSPPRLSPE
jgi:hypothetical protein